MRTAKFALIVAFAATIAACASMGPGDMTSAANFTAMAASGDRFEIQSSHLALNRSHNKDVRKIAKRLIADHTKSSQQMMQIVNTNGMTPPSPALTSDQQRMLADLQNSSNFDGDYLSMQEKAHMEAIKMFEAYGHHGDTPALRHFAMQTLPTLREHYDMVRKAEGQ